MTEQPAETQDQPVETQAQPDADDGNVQRIEEQRPENQEAPEPEGDQPA